MKKLSIIMAVVAAAVMASCGNGTPKANLKTDVDTLSYAIGMVQTRGLKDYLNNIGIDSTYMDEFIKGLNEGANAGDNKKKMAYYMGIQIGQQISQQMVKGINYEIFGNDSTRTISMNNFMAGFVAATLEKGELMKFEEAQLTARMKQLEIKTAQLEKTYGPWKKENETFMKKKAKEEGILALENGVYYKVLEEGKGEVPSDTTRVKVHYEGRLINDTIFDSSYKRNAPTSLRCNQVITGWTMALTHMPVGYIPQELAYGDRETAGGKIKPFSALVFTIELLEIEK